MSKVSKKITNWLFNVLQPQYSHTEVVYRDVYRFLLIYLERGFKIRTAVYTSALGDSELLLNMHGPLKCGDREFHITIWLPLNYPYAETSGRVSKSDANGVPIVFVVPANGEVIRPGNNVDSQGRIYHPFLSQWHNAKPFGEPQANFDLLMLMDCLSATFKRTSPVGLAPQATGPALPPKPPGGLRSPQHTGNTSITSGPPLPNKIRPDEAHETQVPQKYRAPLPLPTQITPYHWDDSSPRVEQSVQERRDHNSVPLARRNSVEHNWPKDITRVIPQPIVHENSSLSTNSSIGSKCRRKPPSDVLPEHATTIENLMDQVTLESKRETSNPAALERIAQHINMHLDGKYPESVNSILPKITETQGKVTSLYTQLCHHNNQAKANVMNLDNHVTYLSTQVQSVAKLNRQLHSLGQMNSESTHDISLSVEGDRKLPVDDLVLPDLLLVRQLYDTAAEIRGYKDAIKLVGGTYKSEPELIRDENLDTCVKSVRALARELFWLEVTRDEIGQIMGLEK
ncbi:ESCRT-I complex subunit TSG101 [Metschnikowia aff. pulcherrima]|uniref:ESCRT-I complex subunit TSG101 n=1 Tax=Metschnikowia aff. pulcherrima TaxID=2163413 RepID=A0A4P6XLL6_9ASCO|nr:ESCRT-I complex subunit TSG101 [Metschnikowia aff. pulcherrima]